MKSIRIKRAYDPYEKDDGTRILVDRLWPRGVSKEEAHITQWMKDIAPSTELRKKFGHDPKGWEEFKKKYYEELRNNPLTAELKKLCEKEPVAFIYAAHDKEHNNAVALRSYLLSL